MEGYPQVKEEGSPLDLEGRRLVHHPQLPGESNYITYLFFSKALKIELTFVTTTLKKE